MTLIRMARVCREFQKRSSLEKGQGIKFCATSDGYELLGVIKEAHDLLTVQTNKTHAVQEKSIGDQVLDTSFLPEGSVIKVSVDVGIYKIDDIYEYQISGVMGNPTQIGTMLAEIGTGKGEWRSLEPTIECTIVGIQRVYSVIGQWENGEGNVEPHFEAITESIGTEMSMGETYGNISPNMILEVLA